MVKTIYTVLKNYDLERLRFVKETKYVSLFPMCSCSVQNKLPNIQILKNNLLPKEKFYKTDAEIYGYTMQLVFIYIFICINYV